MPRAPKGCGKADCPERVTGRTYCAAHEAERQVAMAAKRPGTTARGYGWTHRRDRAGWAPVVQAGAVRCRRCGDLIEPGQAWDLGHNDERTSAAPEHRGKCNRWAAGAGVREPSPRS